MLRKPPSPRAVMFPRTEDQAAQAYAAFDRARAEDCLRPCEHGHLECSATRGGICSDELLATFPQLED